MASEKIRGILLQTARNDFPVFYSKATTREVQLMDMLVLLTALFVRLNDPSVHNNTKSGWRDEERATTRTMFADVRSYIRESRTFSQLPPLERHKIQRVIFDRVK